MDRFFSKLDLRDIKIKPEGTRFLPTDDDETEIEAQESDFDRGYVANSPLSWAQKISISSEWSRLRSRSRPRFLWADAGSVAMTRS